MRFSSYSWFSSEYVSKKVLTKIGCKYDGHHELGLKRMDVRGRTDRCINDLENGLIGSFVLFLVVPLLTLMRALHGQLSKRKGR
jgi:hypothetical protein